MQKEEIVSFWEKHKNNPLSARSQILASLCPQVYGLYVVKMAVALFMAGGLQVTEIIELYSGTIIQASSFPIRLCLENHMMYIICTEHVPFIFVILKLILVRRVILMWSQLLNIKAVPLCAS